MACPERGVRYRLHVEVRHHGSAEWQRVYSTWRYGPCEAAHWQGYCEGILFAGGRPQSAVFASVRVTRGGVVVAQATAPE